MKIERLPDDNTKNQTTEILEKTLLDRVLKLRKLNKEMRDDPRVQKAEDALRLVKLPFKKARLRWIAEMEIIEVELKSRNIKFSVNYDDIYENDLD